MFSRPRRRWPLFDFERLGGTWNRRRLFASVLTELGNVLTNEREGRYLDGDYTGYSIIKDNFGNFFRSWRPSFLPGYVCSRGESHALYTRRNEDGHDSP
ncbi:uncharacterized protein ARMOST_02462 [Armillaria ostoyae]|uniref:Uncharacterized protein n=1 Tax=Armillaria ostoyae TaxID=47428 RepID=A0A284QRR8_ARMOS|nr:uncharacterized protein ARMOST_02462 [Armillaria ostoyae]